MTDAFILLEKRTSSVSESVEEGSARRYRTALLCLPFCLSKSSPSKELATLLARLELSDPKESALEAMNAYISVHFLCLLW